MNITTTTLLTAIIGASAYSLAALVTVVFVAAIVVSIVSVRRFRRKSAETRHVSRIMEYAMELEHITVFRIMMAHDHVVNIHGNYLPEEGVTIRKLLEGIHPDDRQAVIKFLTQLSQGHMATGEIDFRYCSDDTQHWRYIHNSAVSEGRTLPYDIVCTLNDETVSRQERQQEEELGRRYRSIFERSVVGLAIYDQHGMLLAANENMRETLHMEGERDPRYYDISLFSRQPFHDLMIDNELTEYHFCTKLVVPERDLNCYLEFQLKPQLDDQGRVMHYSLSARDVTEERSFYLKNRENDEQIRRANAEIQRYEMELQYLMEKCDMRVWRASFATKEVTIYKGLNQYERKLSLEEMRQFFVGNEDALMYKFAHPDEVFNQPVSLVRHMRPIFHDSDEMEWDLIDSIPVRDKDGHLEGCFGVIRNITPLIEAQEKLKEETRRANDSTRLKSVFMANMTHEIRTPLNSIVGFSDLLPMIESPEEKKEMVGVIMNNCDMLLRLINDILEISTMDGNAIIIAPEVVDFAQIFDSLCESLKQRVQNPAVAFIKENPYTTLTLSVDQRRIQQVITNFVTNAVKYTQQGHIRVGYKLLPSAPSAPLDPSAPSVPSAPLDSLVPLDQLDPLAPSPQELYIYCEDTGTGIPKEQQPTVFERFVKLNDYVQGTGLGLSICKAIADRYGGTIGVDSEGLGHGSTFWLRIPLTPQNNP